jgi:hypothetical protein
MTAGRSCIIPATDAGRWHEILEQVRAFDFYHLPEYHELARRNGEGRGVLLVYTEASQTGAWPFLLRPLAAVEGLTGLDRGLQDATSVYGYPGPLISPDARDDQGFLRRFASMVKDCAADLKLVSMFSRLNPLLENAGMIPSLGTVARLGETVSIDLSLDPGTQWSLYRDNHRRNINRAHRQGMSAYEDVSWIHFEQFVRLYQETMERLDATAYYRFGADHFLQLREALGKRLKLFVAEIDGNICCAAIFVHTNEVIQYHLSGTDPDFARLAPLKLVLDAARLWGNATGARFLHLGGGVGSSEDSLFLFKSGFSPVRHRFCIWKWIVLPELYNQLAEARKTWLAEHGLDPPPGGYFPQYRAG